MPLVTLESDGPLGKAGQRVWVNDDEVAPAPAPAKPKARSKPSKK